MEENANKLHFECTDFNSINLYTWLNEKEWKQPSFDTATETISNLLNIGRQCSKRSAAMLCFIVSRGARIRRRRTTVRWSNWEHFFVHKEDKVNGGLRELLRQKLSALHASSAVRICQLLCTAPLETCQTQVLTNNPGHRRPTNTCLLWYLKDSPVALRLVLSTQRLDH